MKTMSWTQPLLNTDGSPFTQSQYKGYEVQFDGQPAIALPAAWAPDGKYSVDASALQIPEGQHTVQIRVIDKDGDASAWSNVVTFMQKVIPQAPTGFSVA